MRVAGAGDDLAAWDRVAATYAMRIGGGSDPIYQRFQSFLWRHLGDDLSGLKVLDAGCGHGWLADICRSQGATVVGVDGSQELLAIARSRFPDVAFSYADLSCGLPETIAAESFDRVIAHMVLMDIPSLDALAESLRSCVARDGVVVATLPHPSFFNQSPTEDPTTGERYRKVKGYLQHEEWWVTTFGGHRHYHRPFEFYVKWLASAGLGVIDIDEPSVPMAKPVHDQNDYDRWFVSIPTMIGIAARRLDPVGR